MVDDDDGRQRTPDHGHPISSPCEPNGSGELKKALVGQGISEKKIFENMTVRTHADSSTIL